MQPSPAPGQVTHLIRELKSGNKAAADELMPLVYRELKRIAGGIMRNERPGHTLQPTAVVHEAYLRLVDSPGVTIEDRGQFFAIAGRLMRQVLVDHARRKLANKRGGEGKQQVEMQDDIALTEQQSEEVLAVHEALDKLAALDADQARIMEMFYFAGHTVEEIAAGLGMGERTVKRELQTGRLFLKEQLAGRNIELP